MDRLNGLVGVSDQACQTTDRIYTFQIPLPSALTSESVSWGEPEIKREISSMGELWHARLGHTGDQNLRATSKAYPAYNIPTRQVTDKTVQPATCECCAKCKGTMKQKIKRSGHKATRYLERVHMDVCGPLHMKTYEGNQYFTAYVDEYTKFRWVYVHSDRTTSTDILKRFILDATKGTSHRIKCLRTDQAGEHLSESFRKELSDQMIALECSCAYEHHQNGRAEKLIRDLCTMARCMLSYGKVPRDMWGYAIWYAAFVQN